MTQTPEQSRSEAILRYMQEATREEQEAEQRAYCQFMSDTGSSSTWIATRDKMYQARDLAWKNIPTDLTPYTKETDMPEKETDERFDMLLYGTLPCRIIGEGHDGKPIIERMNSVGEILLSYADKSNLSPAPTKPLRVRVYMTLIKLRQYIKQLQSDPSIAVGGVLIDPPDSTKSSGADIILGELDIPAEIVAQARKEMGE